MTTSCGTPTRSRRSTTTRQAERPLRQLGVPENLFHYPAYILHPKDERQVGRRRASAPAPTSRPRSRSARSVVLKRRDWLLGRAGQDEILEFVDLGDDPATKVAALASRPGRRPVSKARPRRYDRAQEAFPRSKIHSVPTAQTAVARMQMIHKQWEDARVRKAMRLALDTDEAAARSRISASACRASIITSRRSIRNMPRAMR